MFQAIDSQYGVPFDGSFRVSSSATRPDHAASKKDYEHRLEKLADRLDHLQRLLYASDRQSLLLVFQALDAAGKDSTIRAVMRGIDPTGCQVFSFKRPSDEELDHDFLWRTTRCLPERGRIGVFNRSYYEEVLVVRVHPEFLDRQRLPSRPPLAELWQQRYESIRSFERHLAANGTIILKFWLNVSKQEQRQRFLSRIDEPDKNWKFQAADVQERESWDAYMAAYEDVLNATSRPWAPWYAIPADDKPTMRLAVADIIADTLKSLALAAPELDPGDRAELEKMRQRLAAEP